MSQITPENSQPIIDLRIRLKETRWQCVPQGIHSVQEIYKFVKDAYPELCDDKYFGKSSKNETTPRPEWQHQVRRRLRHDRISLGARMSHEGHNAYRFA
jgi:hypothetical protein